MGDAADYYTEQGIEAWLDSEDEEDERDYIKEQIRLASNRNRKAARANYPYNAITFN